jgi:hypothetical protein
LKQSGVLDATQVFMFLEAMQGHRQSRMLLAPELTLKNGQQATVSHCVREFEPGTFASADGELPKDARRYWADAFELKMSLCPLIDARDESVTVEFRARAIKLAEHMRLVLEGAEDPGAGGECLAAVDTEVRIPREGAALIPACKVVREVRQETSVPVLGKVPFAKSWFRKTTSVQRIDRMVLLIRPTISSD